MSTSRNAVSHLLALIAIAAIISGADAKPPKRIMGGRLATDYEFSAAVTLTAADPSNPGHFCGGAIIGPRHILTAAHCVEKKTTNRISVRAGIHDIKDTANAVVRSVSKVIVHPDYISFIKGQRALQNDLAILVLKDALTIAGRVQALKLPQHAPERGLSYFVAGWGKNAPKPTETQLHLKTLTMTLISEAECYSLQNDELCAVADDGTLCAGDSGSPAMRGGYLYGIVSASNCVIGQQSILVNVWHFIDWVNEQIRLNP